MPSNGGADCAGQGQETAECEASGEIESLIESFLHENLSQTWRPPPRTPSASSGADGPPGAPPLPAVPSASQQRPGPAPTRPRTISRWDKMRMEEETEMGTMIRVSSLYNFSADL